MHIRKHILGLLTALAIPAAAAPAATINVGTITLEPNKPNQIRAIMVTGVAPADNVQGLNFYAQVADGGPEAKPYFDVGEVKGPHITNVDIFAPGSIFAPNHNPDSGTHANDSVPQLWDSNTTTASGTVLANGLLATVTFDTTGFTSGSFPFLLKDTLLTTTDFAGVPINITNGTLVIVPVPEPTTGAAVLAVGLLAAARRQRRRGLVNAC